jgi:hypothetical protein
MALLGDQTGGLVLEDTVAIDDVHLSISSVSYQIPLHTEARDASRRSLKQTV